MPPLSARFLARRREYIAALEAFRADDLEGCVLAICDALLDAITIAVRAEEAYDRAQAELRAAAGARRDSAAARALAYLAVAPLTEVRALADSLSVSFGAASGAVRALAEAGLLVPENDNLRGRRWRCPRGEKLLREIGA
jgi:DNA-binding MarR family transcriptional regulator